MKKKLLAAVAGLMLFVAALVAAPPAQAASVAEEYAKCTDVYDGANRVCMRLHYWDNGATVTLRSITFYTTSTCGATWCTDWKVENAYVRCAGGLYWWKQSGVHRESGFQDIWSVNPSDLQCNEDYVVFGGDGIIVVPLIDFNESFGLDAGNHLVSD